jgi:hypothetical protein
MRFVRVWRQGAGGANTFHYKSAPAQHIAITLRG